MPMTKTERQAEDERAKERLKKRKQRAHRRAIGAPSAETVARAIVEATAFTWQGVNIERPREERTTMLDIKDVMRAAIVILVRRGHYDAEPAQQAVAAQLRYREEHRWEGHIPTLASAELRSTTSARG